MIVGMPTGLVLRSNSLVCFQRPLHSKERLFISRRVSLSLSISLKRGLVRNKKYKSAADDFNEDNIGLCILEGVDLS